MNVLSGSTQDQAYQTCAGEIERNRSSADDHGADEPLVPSAALFTLAPIEDLAALGALWQSLEEKTRASLFQSWGWMGTWLRLLPDDVRPFVLTARRAETVCGIAIFCRASRRRHRVLLSNGLFLNETGRPVLDSLTVEYNGLLCAAEDRQDLTAGAISFLSSEVGGWDELYLSGVDPAVPPTARPAGLLVHVENEQPCDYVDLAVIRAEKKSYLDCVSRNTRSQIRRALRRYGERGEVSITAAESPDEALAYFSAMKELHQAYWNSRGQPGSFANRFFEEFHLTYIEDRFPFGEIEMLRATAGDETIGYLYNILHDGHVYGYQSGFAYEPDRSMKPGLVSHYMAIERNLAGGAAVYDFMAGYGQHKQSLGTARRQMVWVRAARPRLKYRAEAALRAIRQRVRTARPSKSA